MLQWRMADYAQGMKMRKAAENQRSRRSLESIATDDLKRVTGSGSASANHGFQWELVGGPASTFQMFDML